jgi:hypothetical protein
MWRRRWLVTAVVLLAVGGVVARYAPAPGPGEFVTGREALAWMLLCVGGLILFVLIPVQLLLWLNAWDARRARRHRDGP